MCYERYHWSAEDVENLPVMHAEYVPIIWAAISKIQEDNSK